MSLIAMTPQSKLSRSAAQIPGIAGRHYPPGLAGELYPDGVPIVDEAELEALCRARQVAEVGVCL